MDASRGFGRRRVVLGLALAPLSWRLAWAGGDRPLPRGVAELRGEVTINGQPARLGQPLGQGDRLAVGAGGQLIVVVGEDALLLREHTRLVVTLAPQDKGVWLQGVQLLTGQLLSVFGPGPRQVQTAVATIGIRGTGVYVEARPEMTYVCTCYGTVELAARDDPAVQETVTTRHHEEPRWILPPGSGRRIQPAEMINHTDEELMLLEGVVGRLPPFALDRGNTY